jgi:CheY-like chemotaxis protein
MEDTSAHVLIIAAQPTVRFALEELLRAYGYAVTSVSGAAAIPADAAPETWAVVLVASTVPQTDRYGHAPSDLADEVLEWVPM